MNGIVVRRSFQGFKKVSGTVVRSTLRAVPATVPDTFLNRAVFYTLLGLLSFLGQVAHAQPALEPLDTASGAAGTSGVRTPSPLTTAASTCFPALGTPCCPNYWVVSSRQCAQEHRPCTAGCHFDFVHVSAGSSHRSNQDSFLASLQPGIPVCVVAHGSFVAMPGVEYDWSNIYHWIRSAAPELPLHVVFYTWPSEAPITMIAPIDIAILGRRSAFNGVYLARFLNTIPADHPISLLGHSHGARIVASTLHLLSGGTVEGICLDQTPPPRRMRAVFAAAAIDHDWLNPGERYGQALCNVECLMSLRNQLDAPLAFYPLRKPFSSSALARSGFTSRDRRKQGWLSAKVTELDVTPLVGLGHMWPNYYRHPQIACWIAPYLYFPDLYGPEKKKED